ncbi:hypothetical protein BJ742DRAFT_851048 [Cladochytrium replicatum]|nr:hypothetical protein BJ742DRAFT_851048 [Cladochytrium replicatum]
MFSARNAPRSSSRHRRSSSRGSRYGDGSWLYYDSTPCCCGAHRDPVDSYHPACGCSSDVNERPSETRYDWVSPKSISKMVTPARDTRDVYRRSRSRGPPSSSAYSSRPPSKASCRHSVRNRSRSGPASPPDTMVSERPATGIIRSGWLERKHFNGWKKSFLVLCNIRSMEDVYSVFDRLFEIQPMVAEVDFHDKHLCQLFGKITLSSLYKTPIFIIMTDPNRFDNCIFLPMTEVGSFSDETAPNHEACHFALVARKPAEYTYKFKSPNSFDYQDWEDAIRSSFAVVCGRPRNMTPKHLNRAQEEMENMRKTRAAKDPEMWSKDLFQSTPNTSGILVPGTVRSRATIDDEEAPTDDLLPQLSERQPHLAPQHYTPEVFTIPAQTQNNTSLGNAWAQAVASLSFQASQLSSSSKIISPDEISDPATSIDGTSMAGANVEIAIASDSPAKSSPSLNGSNLSAQTPLTSRQASANGSGAVVNGGESVHYSEPVVVSHPSEASHSLQSHQAFYQPVYQAVYPSHGYQYYTVPSTMYARHGEYVTYSHVLPAAPEHNSQIPGAWETSTTSSVIQISGPSNVVKTPPEVPAKPQPVAAHARNMSNASTATAIRQQPNGDTASSHGSTRRRKLPAIDMNSISRFVPSYPLRPRLRTNTSVSVSSRDAISGNRGSLDGVNRSSMDGVSTPRNMSRPNSGIFGGVGGSTPRASKVNKVEEVAAGSPANVQSAGSRTGSLQGSTGAMQMFHAIDEQSELSSLACTISEQSDKVKESNVKEVVGQCLRSESTLESTSVQSFPTCSNGNSVSGAQNFASSRNGRASIMLDVIQEMRGLEGDTSSVVSGLSAASLSSISVTSPEVWSEAHNSQIDALRTLSSGISSESLKEDAKSQQSVSSALPSLTSQSSQKISQLESQSSATAVAVNGQRRTDADVLTIKLSQQPKPPSTQPKKRFGRSNLLTNSTTSSLSRILNWDYFDGISHISTAVWSGSEQAAAERNGTAVNTKKQGKEIVVPVLAPAAEQFGAMDVHSVASSASDSSGAAAMAKGRAMRAGERYWREPSEVGRQIVS